MADAKSTKPTLVKMIALVAFTKGTNETLKDSEFECTEAEAAKHIATKRAKKA
ncbi:MAG: hypothetical protein AAFN13_15325 [Bacteroidota bacterium]